jgi:hypothetical protein
MYCTSNYVVTEPPIGSTNTLQFRILIESSCLFSARRSDVTDTLSSLDFFQLRKRLLYEESEIWLNLLHCFITFVRQEDGLPVSFIIFLEAWFVPEHSALLSPIQCGQNRIFHCAQSLVSPRRTRTTKVTQWEPREIGPRLYISASQFSLFLKIVSSFERNKTDWSPHQYNTYTLKIKCCITRK